MVIRTVCRAFSSSAARHGLVKTPIQVFGTEGRYASALFSAASKEKSLDRVEKDLINFDAQLAKDGQMRQFLFDPSIKRDLKIEGVQSACKKMNLNPLVANTLVAMAENRRFKEMPALVTSYKTIMAASRGEVQCKVVTAKPLDATMKKDVESSVSAFIKKGEKALLAFEVDASIMGGMVVSIGDKYVDMSLASKLKKFEDIVRSTA